MARYTLIQPETINGVRRGESVELSPEEVNEWIEDGAVLQSHEADAALPDGMIEYRPNLF